MFVLISAPCAFASSSSILYFLIKFIHLSLILINILFLCVVMKIDTKNVHFFLFFLYFYLFPNFHFTFTNLHWAKLSLTEWAMCWTFLMNFSHFFHLWLFIPVLLFSSLLICCCDIAHSIHSFIYHIISSIFVFFFELFSRAVNVGDKKIHEEMRLQQHLSFLQDVIYIYT